MHQQVAALSLPPLVEGPPRGALRLSLGAVRWAAAPSHHQGPLAARVAWWGDPGDGQLLRLPTTAAAEPTAASAAAEATLVFPLHTGPKYLARYLKDAGVLTISIEAAPAAAPCEDGASGSSSSSSGSDGGGDGLQEPATLARASVGLLALDVQAPIEGDYPLVRPAPAAQPAAAPPTIVGSLPVRLQLDYSGGAVSGALVSSFEVNEHLAGASSPVAEPAAPAAAEAGPVDADAAGALPPAAFGGAAPSVCTELAAAMQDRAAALSAAEQAAACYPGQGAPPQLSLQGLPAFLAALLPGASPQQLDYCTAMLLPFVGGGAQPAALAELSIEGLAAAAAECAAVEARLLQQPAAEALRPLRRLAAALGSRSLDLAAAFATAEDGRLPLPLLGALLQRLYPAASEEEVRCLLALLASGSDASTSGGSSGSTAGGVSLASLKAALALALEAQQFPTAHDLEQQQVAAEARRAKEAAAAAAAVLVERHARLSQRQPDSMGKAVSRLKSSLQQRRRSSSGGSQQPEVPADDGTAAPAVPCEGAPPQHLQLPAVVVGIPVLPSPPPAVLAVQEPSSTPTSSVADAGTAPLQVPPAASAESAAASATAEEQQVPAASCAVSSPSPRRQDALLQLIQQAEELKAAMQQAKADASDGSGSAALPPSSRLWAAAAAPSLPNLLLPPAPAQAAAAGSDLWAATAALLAAAKALRNDADQLPHLPVPAGPPALPASASASAAALAALAADSSDAESDAEDALLESLFFAQAPQRQAASAAEATAVGAAGAPSAAAPAPACHPPVPPMLLRLQLQALHLRQSSVSSSSVRCVVKPLHAGGQAQQLTLPVADAGAASSRTSCCHAELPVPATARPAGSLAPALPHYLFLEFWRHSGALLGVAKVPLLQPGPASTGAEPGAAVVAEGQHVIANILEGQDAGSLYVAAVLQEAQEPPQAAALRHCFSVRIHSAHRLPSAAAYAGAGLRAPDARMLRYSFPGEPDALQTQEVACCSNTSFDATASHEMVLPASQSILPLLQEGLLRFEVLDCWADQQPELHGWALLQLSELAGLVADATRSSGGGGQAATRMLLLSLCTEYDDAAAPGPAAAEGAAAARGPSIKVELSYEAQLCTMDAAEAAAAASASAPARPRSPAKAPAAALAASSKGGSGSGGDSDGENSLSLANRGTSRLPPRRPQAGTSGPAEAAALAGLAAPQPTEPFVAGTMAVEVIQASGLAAAVREAVSSGASGTGSLGRAASVGPHAFACLSLFADDPELQAHVPPLRTAFVPQSFCPSWRAAHSYTLRLTRSMLEAFASQSLRVEVWHRCPRSGAAAGAGSNREEREVLLAVGSAPLLDVLRNPQGLRAWVPLAAPAAGSGNAGGGCVGAVQIAVRLTSLGSLSAACSGSQEPLLARCADAAALVPPLLRRQLLSPLEAGLSSGAAVLAVHLDLFSPTSSSSRPRADRWYCQYSLPSACNGVSSTGATTATRVLTCVGGGGSAPTPARSGGDPAAKQQQWGAKLNHAGYFQVATGPELVVALLHAPLLVRVHKQPAAASSAAPSNRSPVLVGTAELGLSSLLWSGSGSSSSSVAGTFPLLGGVAGAQGGASLSARVQLQLGCSESAAQQAAAAAAAGVDATAAAWDVDGSGGGNLPPQHPAADDAFAAQPKQQQEQQEQLQAFLSRSDDEDEAEASELLKRCQRLNAATSANATSRPGMMPAAAAGSAAAAADRSQPARSCASSSRAKPAEPAVQEEAVEQPADTHDGQRPQHGQQQQEQPAATAPGNVAGSQQQQQQQPGKVGASSTGSAAAILQEQEQQPGAAASPDGMLRLRIDTALHLPAAHPPRAAPIGGNAAGGWAAHVQVAWGQQRQRTAAVPVHVVPAADLGGTAAWNVELEIPAYAAAWAAPALAGSSSSGGSGARGPSLLLNVWGSARPGGSGGSQAGSGGGIGDSLIGCAVLDLGLLPALEQLAGWWHITDARQVQQGQIKAAVSADAALLQKLRAQRQAQLVGPADGSSAVDAQPAAAAAALPQQAQQQEQAAEERPADLLEQVQLQLEELQLLSQRIAAGPAASAAASSLSGTSAAARDAAARDAGVQEDAASPPAGVQEEEEEASPAAAAAVEPAGEATTYATVETFGLLPASDDELEGMAPFDARQTGYAWSGSDAGSDDGMLLVGIAVEGAVSPGFTDEEPEDEEDRPPRQPALLLDEDWMFAISKPAQPQGQDQPAEAAAGDSGSADEAAGQRRRAGAFRGFRNVIPGGALGIADPAPLAGPAAACPVVQQQQQQQQPRRHNATVETTAAARFRSAQPAASQQPPAATSAGPVLHQWGSSAPHAAPLQLAQPLPRQGQLEGMPALHAGWQFDIRRPAPNSSSQPEPQQQQQQQQAPGMTASGSAAEVSVEQRQGQAKVQERVQRSPGAAATIDQVLQSLRESGGSGDWAARAEDQQPLP